MRITISLETQSVITQPSPARAKAGGFVPIEIAFTRNSQPVMLPAGATLEFALKPKNTWTGGLLVYHDRFELGAGALYIGTVNFATGPILSALGLSDNAPANDAAQIETSAELVWNIDGQRFHSATFAIAVESPLLDAIIVPPTDPTLYPSPAELQALLDAKASADHAHSIGQVSGLQAALDAKVTNTTLGGYVQRAPSAANFRFKEGNLLQLWNQTTSKWHTVFLIGSDGAAQLTFASTGES